MMTPTVFPSLFSHADAALAPAATSFGFLTSPGLPKEIVVIAWAALLKAYTEQETLEFVADNELVFVDSKDWTIKHAQVLKGYLPLGSTVIHFHHSVHQPHLSENHSIDPPDKNISSRSSSRSESPLSINSSPPSSTQSSDNSALGCDSLQPSLSLKFDANGSTRIHSSGVAVPSAHLPELAKQFLYEVSIATDLFNLDFTAQAVHGLSPSVLNPSPVILQGPQLLHEIVSQGGVGSALAIDFLLSSGKRTYLSYKQLHSKSDDVAKRLSKILQERRVSRNGQIVVPILLPQCPELYIALLAILKSGAAFCPLSLDMPEDRIAFILEDVSASVLVTMLDYNVKVPITSDIKVCMLDDDSYTVETRLLDRRNDFYRQPASDDLAYVLYTSGSTGQPKGVGLPHISVVQSMLAHNSAIPHYRRFLQFASPTFDVSMFEIFFTLFRGSTLVGCSRNELLDDLSGIMNKLDIDAAELTPTVAGSLLSHRDAVPGLKLLLTIGEMLTKHVVEEFGENQQKAGILYGMYGPTEAAIHCTLNTKVQTSAKVGFIGKPFETVSAYVIAPVSKNTKSTDIKILPLGQVGELAIGGHQLATGYLNRPKETQKAFIHHPQYGKLYRTGDKARILPDGNIECLGRIDIGQVKLRGQRVELGEIEQAALQTDGCRLAVATVLRGNLVLFCLADFSTCTESKIAETCRKWLTAFMMPNEIVLRNEFPRLPSGKIDRKTLEASFKTDETRQIRYSAHNSVEGLNTLSQQICDVATEILGRPVAAEHDLSRLGLDSLSAIRLASHLRTQGLYVGSVDILKAKNILSLCTVIKTSQEHEHMNGDTSARNSHDLMAMVSELPFIQDRISALDRAIPCTPLQISMLAETSKNPQAYCNWILFEFDSGVSLDTCKIALKTLFQSSEITRSGFAAVDGASDDFTRLVWHDFPIDNITTVQSFDFNFQLNDSEDLLHPIKVQICAENSNVKALLHIYHALYDGWSLDLLLHDLVNIIEHKALVDRPQFSELSSYFSSLTFDNQIAERDYWEHRLEYYQPSELPSLTGFKPRPSRLSTTQLKVNRIYHNGDSIPWHPQVYFQAALCYLMSSYLGTDDVVVGVVTSGRTIPIPNIENIIGPCIATLPLRVKLSMSDTIEHLLHDVHTRGRELLQYCTLPLRDVKRLANMNSNQSLFDVLFIWQESLSSTKRDAPVRVLDTADFLEFNLVIEVEPQPSGLILKARYRDSLFPEAQAVIFLEQLQEVIQIMSSSPSRRIGDITAVMSSSVLSIQNPQHKSRNARRSIATYVEDEARLFPNKLAVSIASFDEHQEFAETETLTYHELNTKANRLAHYLIQQHVAPDDLVCILMEKSTHLYVAILASIKAGAGYLPLTPETPPVRIKTILADANVRLCLSWSDAPDCVPNLDFVEVSCVNQVNLSEFSDANPALDYDGSHLAYAVFTSGSTGTPKGVLVTQENLASNIEALAELYPVSESSRLLQSCSIAFDVSVFEIFFTWFSGICLCAATNDVLFRDLEEAIRSFRITHLSLTPTVAALIDPDSIPDVSFLVTAGEAVTEVVFRKWAGKGLFQGYGPSETTNICSVNPSVTPLHALNNVGPPLKNTSAFVLSADEGFNLVPRGGRGELCFGGNQIFRGYLNMQKLTSTKVYQHPEYGRIYRSGDLGRILYDGSLLIHGRVDDQVKIRGQRVEMGEINSLIMETQMIQDCVTIALQGRDSQDLIVTFWVPMGPRALEVAVLPISNQINEVVHRLSMNLSGTLPTYMLPSVLIPLSRLPFTAQAKIDKRKLAAIYQQLDISLLNAFGHDSKSTSRNQEPWTEIEHKIATTVAKICKTSIEDISRETSFFNLGLDSVSAIALARYLRVDHDIEVNISWILQHSSVASLATAHAGALRPTDPSTLIREHNFTQKSLQAIREAFDEKGLEVENIRPCTPLQEAMLVSDVTSTNEVYYNVAIFKIQGEVERIRVSFQKVCERHEILRTCFMATEERRFGYAQVVLKQHDLPWQEKQLPEDMGEARLLETTAASFKDAVNGFEPPFTITAYTGKTDSKLVISMHHSLYDGEAISQLLWEVEQAYLGQPLPEVVSFEPVLDMILSANHSRADEYWKRLLKDYISLQFPHLGPQKASRQEKQSTINVTTHIVNLPLTELEQSARDHSSTLLSICQAAWVKVLFLFLGDFDVCFGNAVSGRTSPVEGIERVVAPCFNTIPVRLAAKSSTTNEDIVRKLHKINTDSLEHQFTPLRRIQSKWNDNGDKLFDTLFILQPALRTLDDRIWKFVDEVGGMGFPLVCELTPIREQNRLQLKLHAKGSPIALHDIHYLVDAFDAALSACVKKPRAMQKDFRLPDIEDFVMEARDSLFVADQVHSLNEIRDIVRQKLPQIQDLNVLHQSNSTLYHPRLLILLSLAQVISEEEKIEVLKSTSASLIQLLDANCDCDAIIVDRNIHLCTRLKFQKQCLVDFERSVERSRPAAEDKSDVDGEEGKIRFLLSKFSGVPLGNITPSKTIFQLGLDSINAIQIAKALRNKNLNISAADILQHPTSAGIAKVARQKRAIVEHSPGHFDFLAFDQKHRSNICLRYRIREETIQSIRPCTTLQAGMIAQFLHSSGQTYLNHTIWALPHDVDVQKLKNAWSAIFVKHDMLRTGFGSLDAADFPFAMITYSQASVSLPWTELSKSEKPFVALKKHRNFLINDVAQSFHAPAWRLSICQNHDSKLIQFSAHHAIYDAESLQMMLEDVKRIYNGRNFIQAIPIQPLISSILNSAADTDGESKQYWQNLLNDVAVNKFPNLAPLRVSDRKALTYQMTCSKSKTALDAACRELGVTLLAALQATWARLLISYTGENEVTFGVVLAGRDSDKATDIAFPSTTTVPCRCIGKDSNRVLLNDIMKFNSTVREHQHTPLTHLQRWAGQLKTPLFDTILVLQRLNDNENDEKYWNIVDEQATVEYPVSLEVQPTTDNHLTFQAVFWNDVLPIEQAKILLEQFDVLLVDVLTDDTTSRASPFADSLLSHIPPKTPIIASEIETLHGLFEISARRNPERIALEFHTSLGENEIVHRWSYAQLDAEANGLANYLLEQGVKPGCLVAVCFDKCPEASITLLAIVKAGCGFVALDPSAPVARKAFIVEDSHADTLMTMDSLSMELQETLNVRIICVDKLERTTYKTVQPDSADSVSPCNTSYCLYTSGSTGKPKGCIITHENAVQAMLAFQRLFAGRWNSESRWFQFASFHFDVSVLELFWTWSVGICVVSTPRDILFEDLAGSLRKLNITHIDLTPSLARLITPAEVPSLCKGVFITGGEQLKQEVLDAWGPEEVIHNGYGPTETTIGVTMYTRVPKNGKPSNIGWQFDNVGTYVFRPGTTELVPRGAAGELCISGKLVGKGYLNRDDLTAECFQYVEKYGERIYRTKDLVRMLHDGSFDFLGRCDDQVKLRGQRLELGEVNAAIQECSRVKEVTTLILKSSQNRGDQLVAFVVPSRIPQDAHGTDILAKKDENLVNEMQRVCQERLPGYMIPASFILVNQIPLTVNNKSDSKKLRDVFKSLSAVENYPRRQVFNDLSGDEQKVASVFSSMFSVPVEEISSGSNIFELGLDSIAVFGLTRALREKGFENAQPAAILQSQTIGGLAKLLTSKNDKRDPLLRSAQQRIIACNHRYRSTAAKALGIAAFEIEMVAPCTPLQQGIIARSLESNRKLYFNTFTFDLIENVDERRLRNAWEEVQNNVPILRARFVPTGEGYVQAIIKQNRLSWINLHGTTDPNGEGLVQKCQKEWRDANDEIISMPFQVGTVRQEDRVMMILNIFHACYDATAMPLLLEKVAAVYSATPSTSFGPAFPSVLPYGPLRINDTALEFWTDHLKNVESHDFYRHNQKGCVPDSYVTLQLTDLDLLEQCRRRLNITHQALVQICWTGVLCNFLRNPTTVGVIVSGRSIDYPDAENTIGPLFNTLPFWFEFSNHESWADAAKRCHKLNMQILPLQHTPLRDIMKWCKKNGQIFNNLFVFQKSDSTSKNPIKCPWKPRDTSVQADYPLSFEAEHTEHGALNLTIVAEAAVADIETCRRLLKDFENLLRKVLDDSGRGVEEDLGDWLKESRTTNRTSEHSKQVLHLHTADDFEWTEEASTIRNQIAQIAGIDVSTIRSSSSIFELGMDSIDAIKLSSKLKVKNISLPVSEIMRRPSIAQMIEKMTSGSIATGESQQRDGLIESERALKAHFSTMGLDLTNAVNVLPVTPLQEAMLADMYASDFANYFGHDVLQLKSTTDISRLRRAWNDVISQTSILRSSFISVDDPDIGCAFAQVEHSLKEHQWSEISLHDSEPLANLFEDVRQEIRMALEDTIPFRLTLVKQSDRNYIIVSMAHACYDGWSLGLLHEDVCSAYHDQLKQRPASKATLETILSGSNREAEEFWRVSMADVVSCAFPFRSNVKDTPNVCLRERPSDIPLHVIQNFCKKQNVTLQAIGQLCWSLVLASYVGNLDVTFGVVLSGRDNEEAQEVLFPTMNTVATRIIIHGTRAEMLKYVQANLADLMQYQHFPLRKVQALAGVRDQGLFNTLFIYQKKPEAKNDEESLYDSVGSSSGVEYPVCVEMELINKEFIWRTACENTALDENGVQDLLTRLDGVLQRIIEHPEEAALEFDDETVSVCDLPVFRMHEGKDGTEISARKALGNTGESISEEWSETELIVRNVLSNVSKVPAFEILKHHTIFHLGLDSISAIKVSAMFRKQKNIKLGVSSMLRAGTVEKIASLIGMGEESKDFAVESSQPRNTLDEVLKVIDVPRIVSEAGIDRGNVIETLPASAVQVYFLSTWQNSGGALFYSTFYYRIRDYVDLQALSMHWVEVVKHNSILRTVFAATGNEDVPYVQLILNNVDSTFEDHSSSSSRAFSSSASSPLGKSPPVKIVVKKLHNGFLGLDLTIHHALYDGVSLDFLVQELEDRYNGSFSPPPTPHCTFADFLDFSASSVAQSSRRDLWKKYLHDIASRPSTASQDQISQLALWKSERKSSYKPGNLKNVSSLESLLRREGVSIQAIFLAAFAGIYASLTRSSQNVEESTTPANTSTVRKPDVVLGVYLANRSHQLPRIESLSAPTLSIVPLRIRLPENQVTYTSSRTGLSAANVIEMAKRVQEDLRDISEADRSGVGLWEIERWTGVKVDCFVNFLKLPGRGFRGGNEDGSSDYVDDGDEIVGEIMKADGQAEGKSEKKTTTRTNPISILEIALGTNDIGATEAAEHRASTIPSSPPTAPRAQNAINASFLPSLDIEAAIRDGNLDVGVFCPEGWGGIFSGDEVIRRVFEGLEECLGGLVGKG